MATTWEDGGFVLAVRRARALATRGMELDAIYEKLIEEGVVPITSHCVCVIVRGELKRGEIVVD